MNNYYIDSIAMGNEMHTSASQKEARSLVKNSFRREGYWSLANHIYYLCTPLTNSA